jgi:hypothetical protein
MEADTWRTKYTAQYHVMNAMLGLPSGLFPSGTPTKTLYTPFPCLIRAECLAHLIHLDLKTQIMFGEEYR